MKMSIFVSPAWNIIRSLPLSRLNSCSGAQPSSAMTALSALRERPSLVGTTII